MENPPIAAPSRRWTTLRRVFVGGSLILAPAAQVAAAALTPSSHPKTFREFLAAASVDPQGYVTWALVGVLATALYAPAFLGLARLARERAPATAHIGAALGLVGVLGFFGMHVVYLVIGSFAASGLGVDAIGPALDHLENESPASGVVALSFFVGMFGGFAFLLAAAWRSRVVPRAAVLVGVVFIVFDSGVLRAFLPSPGLLLHVILLAGLGWMGVTVLRMSNGAFERPEAREGWT